MTLPVVRSSTVYVAPSSSLTHTVPKPATIVAGDLLVASFVQSGGGTLTSPDWTQVARAIQSTSPSVTFMTKVATASEPASYVFTNTLSRAAIVAIASVGGAKTTDFVFSQVAAGNTTGFNVPTLSTLSADSLVLTGLGTLAGTHTLPTNQTHTLTQSGSNASVVTSLASAGLAVAGATGTTNWVASAATNGAAISMALQDATSNTPPVTNALVPKIVLEGSAVTLTASATDSDGTIASYTWTCLSDPVISFTGQGTSTIAFTAPTGPRALTFSVTSTDNLGAVSPAKTVGVMSEPPPVVRVGNRYARARGRIAS